MELTAMIEALRWTGELRESPRHIKLISDSRYVVDGINDWRHNWKRNGWRKKAKSPHRVKNVDLWRELDALVLPAMRFSWVKGHHGAHFNILADALAATA
jgi:ribonuclease HI